MTNQSPPVPLLLLMSLVISTLLMNPNIYITDSANASLACYYRVRERCGTEWRSDGGGRCVERER